MKSATLTTSLATLWRSQEIRLLAPIVALGIAVWSFMKIASEVLEGEVHALDQRVLNWCRVDALPDQPWGPLWFQEGMRDLTALGSPVVLAFTVVAVWGGLMLARQRGMAALLSGAVGVSRVYLGVHWASDVAAGWAGGAAWALVCWLLARQLGLGRGQGQGTGSGPTGHTQSGTRP